MLLAEERKRQALEAAEACARALTQRFGARRVMLFGSLAQEQAWRERSDIDIAVEGLQPTDFFPAYSACRDLLPPDLELDLVPLENASPELRARILGEADMPQEPLLALKVLVEDELTSLERVSQEMQDLMAECAQPPTRTELRAMASILHEFYNGVERILERVAVGLQADIPHGSRWHVDLLNWMAEAHPGPWPAVIDEPLRARLKEYLDFRHFFRHAYGYTLEWNQVRWKVEAMPETLAMLRGRLHTFFQVIIGDRAENSG